MNFVTSVVCSLVVAGVGCGGAGGGITQRPTSMQGKILLDSPAKATGTQDALDSVWVAMTGVGCTPVKPRYPIGSDGLEGFDATCGTMAIKFTQTKGVASLSMYCDEAAGADACKSQFAKILGMARDAKYIE